MHIRIFRFYFDLFRIRVYIHFNLISVRHFAQGVAVVGMQFARSCVSRSVVLEAVSAFCGIVLRM